MEIDLRRDAADLRALLVEAVATYAKRHQRRVTSVQSSITRIGINFWLGDGGPSAPFALLQFDTRPDAQLDGSPTYPKVGIFKRPQWRKPICDASDGGALAITLLNNQHKRVTPSTLTRTFGAFFVDALKSARADGVWNSLPMSFDYQMDVEESGGNFGWSARSLRGREKLAPAIKKSTRHEPVELAVETVQAAITKVESMLAQRGSAELGAANRREARPLLLFVALALAEADPIWRAIKQVGRFAKAHPEAVWVVTHRWGGHSDLAVRLAAAVLLLQPLLSEHFDLIFPQVRRAALADARFAKIYQLARIEGQASRPASIRRQARLSADLARIESRRSLSV